MSFTEANEGKEESVRVGSGGPGGTANLAVLGGNLPTSSDTAPSPESGEAKFSTGRLVACQNGLVARSTRACAQSLRLRRGSAAFTLIELLVVIAILLILAGLLLAAVSRAEARGHRIACVSNFKQFGIAHQLYVDDHTDHLLPNLDGQDIPLGQTWVQGWLGLPGPDCTNTLYLKRSLLGAYLGDSRVWQCPSAEPVTVGRVTQDRVRTLSLNCFLGSPVQSPAAKTYLRMADVTQPGPAEMLTFLEERESTINDGAFSLQWDFDKMKPSGWQLRDKPATRHDRSGNLAFADGHIESHRWTDARTLKPPRDDAPMPENKDILWMQERGTWREAGK